MNTRFPETGSHKQAHTLIELLVVMAMLVLMASGIAFAFKSVLAYDRADEARSTALEEAVRAAETIARHIASATAIDSATNTTKLKVTFPPNTSIAQWDHVAYLQYEITNAALRQTIGLNAGQTFHTYLIEPYRNPQYAYGVRHMALNAVTNIPLADSGQEKLRQLTIEMEVHLAKQPSEIIMNRQWILLHNLTP